MGAPKKVGTVWSHCVMIAGERASGTLDTKAAALAWEAEQRVATPKSKVSLTKTCADAFEKYELEVSKTKRGYWWEALRLTAMAETDLGKVRTANVNTTHIAAWRDQRLRQVASGSATREISLLSSRFSVVPKEGKWITQAAASLPLLWLILPGINLIRRGAGRVNAKIGHKASAGTGLRLNWGNLV